VRQVGKTKTVIRLEKNAVAAGRAAARPAAADPCHRLEYFLPLHYPARPGGVHSMVVALWQVRGSYSPGVSLFLFSTFPCNCRGVHRAVPEPLVKKKST